MPSASRRTRPGRGNPSTPVNAPWTKTEPSGATALAAQSDESPAVLRERVTSKGGTTYAALQSLRADAVCQAITKAVKAAQLRARELGDEFGG